MVTKVANRDVVNFAARFKQVDGYGAMWTVGYPCGAGIMPHRLKKIFEARQRHWISGEWNYSPNYIGQIIYSYATPIAWFDTEFNVWVVPDVSYSVTTAKHRGYLWRLSYEFGQTVVSIPWDASLEEYRRVCQGKMEFTRTGTKPGPNWTLD